MKNKLMTLAALVLALSPAIALAHPVQNVSMHERPAVFHDHGSKPHLRSAVAHH